MHFGLTEFDLSLITSKRRRVIQEAARYAQEMTGQAFVVVRYLSPLKSAWEPWAVFHPYT